MNSRFSTNTMLVINLSASLIFNSSFSIAADKPPATHSNKNAVIATAAGLATGASVIYTTGEQLKAQKQSLAQIFATATKAAPPTPSFPSPAQTFDSRTLQKGDIFVAEGVDRSGIEKQIEEEKTKKAQLEKNSGKGQSDIDKLTTKKEITKIDQKIAELKKTPGRIIFRTVVVTKSGSTPLTPESLVQLFKDQFKNFTPQIITERIQMVQTTPFKLANTVHDTATKKLAAGAVVSVAVAGVTYYLLEKHAKQERIAEASIRHLSPQQSPNNKSVHGNSYDRLLPNTESNLGIPNSEHHLKSNTITDATQDMARASNAVN